MNNTTPEFASRAPETPASGEIEKPAYSFVQLDPRPGATNPDYNFGIEITDPKLLKADTINLDHHGKEATVDTPSACEQALTIELPEEGIALATVRVDKDSLTAMAVLESRKTGRSINEDLVRAVGEVDRFGPRVAGRYETFRSRIIALDRMAGNFKSPLSERVKFAQQILDETVDMEQVEEMAAARDREFEQAANESKVTEIIPGKLTLVESKHRFATNLGYEKSPTIVAFNPEMQVMTRMEDGSMKPSGETYAKFTIARYDDHVATDINGALNELRALEAEARGVNPEELKNNWGGRGDIIGSPQNESSKLSVQQVVDVVTKYVR